VSLGASAQFKSAEQVAEEQFGLLRRMGDAPRRLPIVIWNPAWLTLLATLGLCAIGIHCIDLTGGVDAEGVSPLAKRQIAFMFFGLLGAAVVAVPHYKFVARMTPLLAAAVLVMLIFLLIPMVPESIVSPRKGARRWINLGFVDFQPSELAKIVYVLAVARYLRYRKNHRRFLGLAPPAIITFVPMALILVEPDLGTALLFLPTLFAMLIVAGARLKHLILVVVVAGAMAPAMYPLLQPHQKDRIRAIYYQFIGDDRHQDSINYQGNLAMTVAGAGGIRGHSAEKSRALIHFNHLPEDHNDMIFAVATNRFGMLGGVGVIGLYMLWVVGAMWTAALCREPVGRLVAVGLGFLVITQMTINIGMTIGILPITGMTLPFVSYGGSSLIAGFLMVGLICNIGMRRPAYLQRRSFEFDDEDDDD